MINAVITTHYSPKLDLTLNHVGINEPTRTKINRSSNRKSFIKNKEINVAKMKKVSTQERMIKSISSKSLNKTNHSFNYNYEDEIVVDENNSEEEKEIEREIRRKLFMILRNSRPIPFNQKGLNTLRDSDLKKVNEENIIDLDKKDKIEIENSEEMNDKNKINDNNLKLQLMWSQHRWLNSHGKISDMKSYRDKMKMMRRWFEFLDADGSGEIGIDELEDPLVSVGLAKSRDDVRKLIRTVDSSENGEVNFDEFLTMMNEKKIRSRKASRLPNDILNKKGPKVVDNDFAEEENPVVKLFTDLQNGKLGDLALPLPILITAYRRKMLLNAHLADKMEDKGRGLSVLQALEKTRNEAMNEYSSISSKDNEVSNFDYLLHNSKKKKNQFPEQLKKFEEMKLIKVKGKINRKNMRFFHLPCLQE